LEFVRQQRRTEFFQQLGDDGENKRMSVESLTTCLGHLPVKDFVNQANQSDLVITGVTMALHIANALKKRIVPLNNLFNKNEFELYGHGEIIEPDIDCKGCFRTKCEENYMELVKPEEVFRSVEHLINSKSK
jgi:ADP-heptose:LPS heptosyltransferase